MFCALYGAIFVFLPLVFLPLGTGQLGKPTTAALFLDAKSRLTRWVVSSSAFSYRSPCRAGKQTVSYLREPSTSAPVRATGYRPNSGQDGPKRRKGAAEGRPDQDRGVREQALRVSTGGAFGRRAVETGKANPRKPRGVKHGLRFP